MINNARGSHVSPGVYMKEVDVTYSTKSLGQTTLGLVGETQKGPAFQPINIQSWAEFVEYFGETSPEKFIGENKNDDEPKYLKYELPYVAKSYLKESKQLEVCRVLGLSGYNAGSAWAITANTNEGSFVIGIIRSKGHHNPVTGSGTCGPTSGDEMVFDVKSITRMPYKQIQWVTNCEQGIHTTVSPEAKEEKYKMNLKIALKSGGVEKEYPISMVEGDMDYILNVIGSDPLSGSAPVFVEELYDLAFSQIIDNVNSIGIKEIPAMVITGSFSGFTKESYVKGDENKLFVEEKTGQVFKVNEQLQEKPEKEKAENGLFYAVGENMYQFVKGEEDSKFVREADKADDYKEEFRSAMTPWVVSEIRGNGKDMDLKTLFRFYTISDGNAANEQVKVSIQNINMDYSTFDVIVRDFYDTDKSPIILEKFTKCSMRPNSKDYIAYKIGTIDGSYELKSSYIMVEVNESEEVYNSVPCGFLGYPTRYYGESTKFAPLKYNLKVESQLRPKEQYFGFSDITGIDVDVFSYKGRRAYNDEGQLSNGFHLDERISQVTGKSEKSDDGNGLSLTVMGKQGYMFDTVTSKDTNSGAPAIMFTEASTVGSIYEDKKMRKFTVCFYGGFDGWDIYRKERSNVNDFRVNNYKGSFYTDGNPSSLLDLPSWCNKSDYYAYLAGIRTFANPEAVDINIFATPGINWYNHSALSQDAITMIEDADEGRGGDAIYVLSAPLLETAEDVVGALEETGIDSSYAVTFWPWVKYYDYVSQVYVNLPVTKDVVRNMAYIDRTSYPWFAPAGMNRGPVDCVRATSFTRLSEEDTLYNGMVNPVKTFAVDGVKIWGNKTIYSVDSPLNRVNVRRLMIRVKKLISTACRSLIFEPNDSTIKSQFLSIVEPILDNVRDNRGIYEYKVIVDDSPEAIDAHTLPAKIMIKPTPTLEYIDLTFVITPTGASFEE